MHVELLEQAEFLAMRDPRRPKQVNLRRAVSAVYYAIFHFLVDAACRSQLGNQHSQASYRHVLGRAFSHSNMKLACNSFAGGTLKKDIVKTLPAVGGQYVISPAIRNLASAFVDLQFRRHVADYDRAERFSRVEVLWLLDEVRKFIADFEALPLSDDRAFFLACLWAYKELANR